VRAAAGGWGVGVTTGGVGVLELVEEIEGPAALELVQLVQLPV
jgi:hypothetical protein